LKVDPSSLRFHRKNPKEEPIQKIDLLIEKEENVKGVMAGQKGEGENKDLKELLIIYD
jgi:hypothetical protein